ncbi:hypothetical protein J6590_009143 [Homalodisca vitripennis]|nr:hypothetical protein J6590_009143 [Homalodisca vitripennis]
MVQHRLEITREVSVSEISTYVMTQFCLYQRGVGGPSSDDGYDSCDRYLVSCSGLLSYSRHSAQPTLFATRDSKIRHLTSEK